MSSLSCTIFKLFTNYDFISLYGDRHCNFKEENKEEIWLEFLCSSICQRLFSMLNI